MFAKEKVVNSFNLEFATFWNEKQKFTMNELLNWTEIWHIWYGGGAGWWKSYLIAGWSWILCTKYPGIKWFWWRRELKELKNSTYASYNKFCSDYNIPMELRWEFKQLDSKIIFANGSEIVLLWLAYSPQDPEYANLGSTEYTFWAIDEAQEVPEKAISILTTRVWRWKNKEYGIRWKVLETFNPDKGHVFRRYYKPWRDFRVDDYKFFKEVNTEEGVLQIPYLFIPALLTDNKRLAFNDDGTKSDYYIELLTSDEVTKQRLLYGNFEYDNTPWRLFQYDKLDWMDKNVRRWGIWYITVDVARAGKDYTEIFVWEWLDITERIREAKSKIDELSTRVKEIAERKWIPMSRVIWDENGVGWGLIDNTRCVWFVSTRSQIWKSKARNYDSLKAQVVHIASLHVNAWKVGWFAWEWMEKLKEDLDSFLQINIDNDKTFQIIKKDQQKALLWRSPDLWDCFIMRFFFEINRKDGESEVVQWKNDSRVYHVDMKIGNDGEMIFNVEWMYEPEEAKQHKEWIVDMWWEFSVYGE